MAALAQDLMFSDWLIGIHKLGHISISEYGANYQLALALSPTIPASMSYDLDLRSPLQHSVERKQKIYKAPVVAKGRP